MDYLKLTLEDKELNQISTLGLAHIGDCVFEIMTRSKILCTGALTPKNLHRETINIVNAKFQAELSRKIFEEFSEEERDVFKRGRNSKPKIIPKNTAREDYALATALEALFGYLYLKGRYDRLNELYAKMFE